MDKNNKGKVIQTIACVFRAIECMVCRCESAEVGLKFRVKMACFCSVVKNCTFLNNYTIFEETNCIATLSTSCPTKVQSSSEKDFLRFAVIFRICLINADIRSQIIIYVVSISFLQFDLIYLLVDEKKKKKERKKNF